MRHVIVVWLMLAMVLSPSLLTAQTPPKIEDLAKLLEQMADPKRTAEQRAAARDELIAQAGPEGGIAPTERIELARKLADLVQPLMDSKDQLTALNAAIAAARIKHLHFVPVLAGGAKNGQPMVRYWSAKGLADAQPEMYNLGDRTFFEDPIKALAAQAGRETSAPVVEEIYRALSLTNPARMADPRKNLTLHRAFMTVLVERVKRLDQHKLDGSPAEVAGLAVSRQWAEAYRNQKAVLADILFWQGQLLKWAQQLYVDRQADLTEEHKGALERLILRASEALSEETGKPRLREEVRQHLLLQRDVLRLEQTVLMFVGGPGMEAIGWELQKHGVTKVAADLSSRKAPASQPDKSSP